MKKEINLVTIGGIALLVILLVVAALLLVKCDADTAPTEATNAPTESNKPTDPDHEHQWSVVVTEPDCVNKGYTTYTCACGESYADQEVEALGHAWKDASCTEAKTCTVCNTTEGEAKGHNYEQSVTAADCLSKGFTTHTCANCGDSYIGEEVEAKGHSWVDATCTEAKHCSVCNAVTGRAKGHSWDNGVVTKEATEEKDGEKLITCTACRQTKTQVIPSLNHEHKHDTAEVTPATCTEGGFTTHICRCGDSYVDSKVPALGHSWKDATCTTPKVCSTCGETEGTAKGHSWKDATCTEAKTCTTCGSTLGTAKGHNEMTIRGKTPTCTETGLTEGKRCSVCNVWTIPQNVIGMKPHTEQVVSGKEATCTETGLTEGKRCSVCNVWIIPQNIIEMKPHTEEVVPGKAATCTENGLTDGKKCSVCGTVLLAQETIPAPGHTEEVVSGHDATCTETGLTDGKKCKVCGAVTLEQQTINAKGHKKETVKGYDSTFTATGLTDGEQCSVCKAWLTEQQVIPQKEGTAILDGNGGAVSPASVQVVYGNKYGNLPTPTRTGYTFGGWQLNGTIVTKDTVVSTAGNHTLVAQWTANTYTVTYNANGGSVSPGNAKVTYDSTYGNLPTPTRANYVFLGWTLNGATVTSGTKVTTTSNHTLVAQWTLGVWNGRTSFENETNGDLTIDDDTDGWYEDKATGLDGATLRANGYNTLWITITVNGERDSDWWDDNKPYVDIQNSAGATVATAYLDAFPKNPENHTVTIGVPTSTLSSSNKIRLRFYTEGDDWEMCWYTIAITVSP